MRVLLDLMDAFVGMQVEHRHCKAYRYRCSRAEKSIKGVKYVYVVRDPGRVRFYGGREGLCVSCVRPTHAHTTQPQHTHNMRAHTTAGTRRRGR